jgi:hypothetical protein
MNAMVLNFMLAALVGMSSFVRTREVPAPRSDGVYLVAMSVPAERIAELHRYDHDALRLDVQVLPSFSPALTSWSADRRQFNQTARARRLHERGADVAALCQLPGD